MKKGFTLIELLVVTAIIAILAVTVILTINPAELLKQGRDATRISDMSTLNKAISLYYQNAMDNPSTMFMGTSSVVYISIPDPNATTTMGTNCASLNLPTLPSTYTYHCVASSTYRNNNGTGWIPINFTALPSGAPLSNLPTDPTDTSSSRMYYTYTTDGTQFEVTSDLESAKYKFGGQSDQIANDGGAFASIYEKGSKLGLEPLDYGDNSLVGYWTFDEGTGTIAYDYSGTGNPGTWNGTMTNGSYYTPGKVGSYAGLFTKANNNYISIPDAPSLDPSAAFTAMAWVNLTAPTGWNTIFGKEFYNSGTGWFFVNNDATSGQLTYFKGGGWPYVMSGTNTMGVWHLVTITNTNGSAKLYVNGTLVSSGAVGISTTSLSLFIGARHNNDGTGFTDTWSGSIDDARLYNRALSANEIRTFYNAQK